MSNRKHKEMELIRLLEIEAIEKARDSFLAFVLFCNPDYQVNWHHKLIAKELEDFYYSAEINRMMIFIPPQHGKSELASRYFPAWVVGKNNEIKICEASYTIDLSRGFSRDVQRIIRSDEFAKVFPETTIKQKADTDKWIPIKVNGDDVKESRGFYKAVGVCGGLTGNSVDLGIIDDPVKDAIEANSEVYQGRAWNWYTDVFSTRLHNDSKQLLIMTRWNEADLAGKLLDSEPEKWRVLRIPAIREDLDFSGDPRQLGEPLWAERHSLEKIMQLKSLNERTFTALYQQRPSPAEGNVIPVKNIRFYRNIPENSKKYISWDLTFKDSKKSDFVSGQVWCVSGVDRYLVDRVHGRYDFVKTLSVFVDLCNKHSDAIAILVEDKANGPAVISTLKDKVGRLIAINPKDSKYARAQVSAKSIEAGNVLFPDLNLNPWAREVYEEMRTFPNSPHDDDVDAWSQFENYVFVNNKRYSTGKIKGLM